VIVKELRIKGIKIFAYLDDWMIWASSYKQCLQALETTCKVIEKYGFIINQEKSIFTPTQVIQWLGLIWDTRRQTLSLPLPFQSKVRDSIMRFLQCKFITRRHLEHVVGLLNFACIANPLAKIFLKRVNRALRDLARNRLRDIPVPLSPELRVRLSFWLRPKVLESHVPWRSPPPTVDLFTDASNAGWGFHTTDHQEGRGQWKPPMNTFHINIKEFVAVWIALQKCKWKEGTSIRLHSDNTSVVNCLNRGGSTRSIPLWSWTLSIARFLDSMNWTLSAVHIKGELNALADSLSRSQPVPAEWMLDTQSFRWVISLGSAPQVDLMATSLNHRLPLYVSPFLDHQAVAVDAMSINWNRWNSIYIFPPVKALPMVLSYLPHFKGRVTLIAPWWPTQSWFPGLLSLCSNPKEFPRAVLSQQVQGRITFCDSYYPSALRVWIF